MRIGRLRIKHREVTAEPGYYNFPVPRIVGGYVVGVHAAPFDGRSFLFLGWTEQNSEKWFGRCIGGLVQAAVAASSSSFRPLLERKMKESHSREVELRVASFECCDCPHELLRVSACVSGSYKMEGRWIGDSSITVLCTTTLSVKVLGEEHRFLLPPGTVGVISPLSLAEKFGGESRGTAQMKTIREATLFPSCARSIASEFLKTKTIREAALFLGLEPVRLQQRLVSREGAVR